MAKPGAPYFSFRSHSVAHGKQQGEDDLNKTRKNSKQPWGKAVSQDLILFKTLRSKVRYPFYLLALVIEAFSLGIKLTRL